MIQFTAYKRRKSIVSNLVAVGFVRVTSCGFVDRLINPEMYDPQIHTNQHE